MYKILRKEKLNPTVTRMEILAPEVAAKAEPGQFIILRPQADSDFETGWFGCLCKSGRSCCHRIRSFRCEMLIKYQSVIYYTLNCNYFKASNLKNL